jgi:hypothetical protein
VISLDEAEIGDLRDVIKTILAHCQGVIERQMELLLRQLGSRLI